MKQKILSPADPKILTISIEECGEDFIDLKDQTILKYGPPPECIETKDDYTKLRKTVYEKLCRVREKLPKGYFIRLYDSYRSLAIQKWLFEEEYTRVKKMQPHFFHEECFQGAARLVSPVTMLDGKANVPPHSTGGAVDVEVIHESGELLDMGMAIKDWNRVEPDCCRTDYEAISSEAKANRQLLLQLMEAEDFVNYPMEWWHFSYGDRYWAYHKNQTHAVYGGR
jgi:D-alanyl-D-alanine dipeptidase